MMIGKYTLSNFYTSKEWINLMKQIKIDRLNEEGHLICAYCEKPIVRAYDCIGHHMRYLTEENVNDVMISLNPANIALLHHRCHNRVHGKLQYNQRKVYLVFGPPLSGKTTYVSEIIEKGDLIVDLNNIWRCVTGGGEQYKDGRLNDVVFDVRNKLIEDIKYRRGRWVNAFVVGGYPLISERQRLCRELGAEEIYVECSKDECINRLMAIEDERNKEEYIKYIETWFSKYGPQP